MKFSNLPHYWTTELSEVYLGPKSHDSSWNWTFDPAFAKSCRIHQISLHFWGHFSSFYLRLRQLMNIWYLVSATLWAKIAWEHPVAARWWHLHLRAGRGLLSHRTREADRWRRINILVLVWTRANLLSSLTKGRCGQVSCSERIASGNLVVLLRIIHLFNV